MKNFNSSSMGEEPSYQSSSQINLQAHTPRLLHDEMSQDLNYLSREAPLDGGESTFGAYSQLGGSSSQHLAESPTPLDQLAPDNVELVGRAPTSVQQAGFLVSFMVDARGGAMRGCRHSGVRVIIPAGAAQAPTRITCRYLRRERLVHPPPLMEGEACASKIMEVGPAGARFLSPVLLEVPHFASLRGQEREVIVLRSDSGEVWREHLMELADEKVAQRIADQLPVEAREPVDENREPGRLTRIVTTEFPQYFAIISRVRQQVTAVGPEGALVHSAQLPKVQATFTEGALTKRIKIGLQAQSVPNELVMKLFGSLSTVTFSPIVTIEPRRRKFHCPIRLRIPLPSGYRTDSAANLRLLCSITGGQNRAIWEDVTGSTPISIVDDCLVFTTTVSARFWLIHCRQAQLSAEATKLATEIYRYLIRVPFVAKFVIFAKRRDINEAWVRVFCMTDDREERTLEVQEHYSQVAKSREVEVLDNQSLYLEFGGNLTPRHLSGSRRLASSSAFINEQLAFVFRAFQENRIAFIVALKDVGQEASGKIAFMEDSIRYLSSLNAQQRAYLAEQRRRAVCTLGIQLPAMLVDQDHILGTPKRNSYYASARIGDLSLAEIAQELEASRQTGDESSSLEGSSLGGGADSLSNPTRSVADWVELAPRLGIPRDEVEFIADYAQRKPSLGGRGPSGYLSASLILLMHWYKLSSAEDRDQDLARALLAIGRDDIARKLNFPIEPKKISRSTMELLRDIELIPVRSQENLYAGSELSVSRGRLDSGSSATHRAGSRSTLHQLQQADGREWTTNRSRYVSKPHDLRQEERKRKS